MMLQWQDVFNQGERVVEPQASNWEFTMDGLLFLRHLIAYHSVIPLCKGKKVLEVGCGSGYGSNLLSHVAAQVVSIDIDPIAIQWAESHYQSSNLAFKCASIHDTFVQAETFDVIVSFQVVEHVRPSELEPFMMRICNILNIDGVAYFTTPNRLNRHHILQKSQNPYHFTEYSPWSMRRKLRKYFKQVTIKGITGNSEVMKAEWFRGSRVTPIEYFFLGPTKEVFIYAWRMWHQLPDTIRYPARQLLTKGQRYLSNQKQLNGYSNPGNATEWQPNKAFSLDDFMIISSPDWWCLDLFAEVRAPKFSNNAV